MTEQAAPLDPNNKMHFHLVLAEVVFETRRGGISSHRTQFMTQSPIDEFPADRIRQLQNSAAFAVREKVGVPAKNFVVHDVLFLHIHYCGHLTHEEFYGKDKPAPVELLDPTPDAPEGETPVSDGETASADNNVVRLQRTP